MADVLLGRAHVAEREPQHVAVVQPRVRDEDLAARVHALQQRLVLLVRTHPPKADEGELRRGAQLPARLVAYPALEQPGQANVLADLLLEPLAAEAAQDSPKLQRPEPAPEGRA